MQILRFALRQGQDDDSERAAEMLADVAPPPPPAGGQQARQRLANAFTPTRPLPGGPAFGGGQDGMPLVGREAEHARVMGALVEDRAHVLLYGDRGCGKTSLSNGVIAAARDAGFEVARHVCSTVSCYDSIMRALFQSLPRWLGEAPGSGDPGRGAAGLLPAHPLQPGDVLATLGRLQWLRLLMLVDEFDRVSDVSTRTAVADTIKQCADSSMPLSFMLIGVSDTAEQLLGRHPSIQRCVQRVVLPLLGRPELERLVAEGSLAAGLAYPAAARTCIAALSCGLPYMAQLLSLRAGQAALAAGRGEVRAPDLVAAAAAAVAEADPRLLALYDRLTVRGRDAEVLGLLRLAAATRDPLGRLRLRRDGRALRLADRPVPPAAWKRLIDGGAIRAVDECGSAFCVFADAMLPQLVVQRAFLAAAGR